MSFSALAVFSHNVLYKSTFYLLTYLLTDEVFIKFEGFIPESTRDTAVVAFPRKPV